MMLLSLQLLDVKKVWLSELYGAGIIPQLKLFLKSLFINK